MIKQIKNLTKLQLKNLYGINVLRHTKDKKERRKKLALAAVYVLLILMVCFYVGLMAFGYTLIGLEKIVPAYLIMLSSLVILFFAIFKAGSVIFQKNSYDILCSLPVWQTAIVVSRFARMYVENLLLTVVVMLPGILVYGIMIKPEISFYLIGVLVTILVPLLPITIATVFGALVTAIASRMKHKSMVTTVLSMLFVVVVMAGTAQLSTIEDEFSIEMLQNISDILYTTIESVYPPAVWLGDAMINGDFVKALLCLVGGLLAFAITIAIVSSNFHWICRGLFSTSAKHNYQMGKLEAKSVLGALYKREWKRYFSSSVYVSNTIVGPIMGVMFAVAVLSIGVEQIQQTLGIPLDIKGAVPFVLAGIFGMMSTTSVSVSMEGKEWWIVKSLPIKAKDLFDSKLLLNISLVIPFYLVSEVLLIIALKPTMAELVWILLVPAVFCLFEAVFGLTINLKMPVLQWENETTVVKQSAASLFGGLGGMLIALLCMAVVLVVPAEYTNLAKAGICVLIGLLTLVLYRKNNSVNLQEL